MRLEICIFNEETIQSDINIARREELRVVLEGMPLHIKASDQAGIQGNWIFDPVGTNEYIKKALIALGWHGNVPLPTDFQFLGTDVDFLKNETLVEAQFSNYPFLLNNLLRSELFHKSQITLGVETVKRLIIITKCHLLPASNSTLYYEQAQRQVGALSTHGVFQIPIELIGLGVNVNEDTPARITKYASSRYSRSIVDQKDVLVRLNRRSERSRCIITITEGSSTQS